MRRKRSKPSFTNILEVLSQERVLPPKHLHHILQILMTLNMFFQLFSQMYLVRHIGEMKRSVFFLIQRAAYNEPHRS